MRAVTCSPELEELARRSREVYAAAAERAKRSMPFLLRWRDRLVYSVVLACGAGALLSTWRPAWGAAAIAPAGLLFFLLLGRYDRAAAHAPEFTAEERAELLRLAAGISRLTRAADEPEFPYWRPRRPTMGNAPCGWCGRASRAWAGRYRPYSPTDADVDAACVDCLRAGCAAAPATEGELLTLRQSIAGREPDLSSGDLDQRVRAAVEELRRTPLPPHPVAWPQCCADFCRFEGAWGVGDFAVAAGSFDGAVLAEFIDHAVGRTVPRAAPEIAAYADALVASEWVWQVFRCRSCGRLFATEVRA
jgi:hypothetical protein